MDELVAFVSQKTGLSEEMSRKASEAAIRFLKDRLAAPIAGQIDGVLSGQGAAGGGGMAEKLGGMFGGK